MTTTTHRWLFPHEVRAIRRLRREGQKVVVIAWALGLRREAVSKVVNRKSYTHVPDDLPVSPHPWDSMAMMDIYREPGSSTRPERDAGAIKRREPTASGAERHTKGRSNRAPLALPFPWGEGFGRLTGRSTVLTVGPFGAAGVTSTATPRSAVTDSAASRLRQPAEPV